MICSQSQEEMFVSLLKLQHLHPNMGRIERHNSSRRIRSERGGGKDEHTSRTRREKIQETL